MEQNHRSNRDSVRRILVQVFRRHPVLTSVVVLLVAGSLLMRDRLPISTSAKAPSSAHRSVSEQSRLPTGHETQDVGVQPSFESQLTRLSNDVYESTVGLRYTAGSQHRHRLKHVMSHARDAPGRPGKHGVFTVGGQDEIVALIDEAFVLTQHGGPRVRQRTDRNRTIWTVDMQRPIGYVGGQYGNRHGRPSTQHLRLVLEDNRVITAYPLVP